MDLVWSQTASYYVPYNIVESVPTRRLPPPHPPPPTRSSSVPAQLAHGHLTAKPNWIFNFTSNTRFVRWRAGIRCRSVIDFTFFPLRRPSRFGPTINMQYYDEHRCRRVCAKCGCSLIWGGRTAIVKRHESFIEPRAVWGTVWFYRSSADRSNN